jgi:ABC-2 type transport system ATP-binding protein
MLITPLKALPEIRDAALFGSGLHIVTPDGEAATAATSHLLKARGLSPEDFTIETILPSMEDVFISLIEEEDRKRNIDSDKEREEAEP